MGSSLSSFFSSIFEQPEMHIMMIGLDAAGKTTILYRIKEGIVFMTTPTIGFNVESVKFNNLRMTIWDVGGQEKIRPLWRRCWNEIHAIVYVVDLSDRERITEAGQELRRVLDEERLRDAVLLVFANKQDKYIRMTVEEVTRILRLPYLPRKWRIQGCSALTGEGLPEGLHWLRAQLRKHR